jgi:tRNA (guanine-N7-)-methyltransferase
MPWENRYMRLVDSKPGIIVSEVERDVTPELQQQLRSKRAAFPKVFVELGCGSGMHLLKLAALHPDTLCVGFEMRFKRAFRTGEKAEELQLPNVLVIRGDARRVQDLFEDGSVDGFFINYPDPWAKRRWRKNRLLSESLLDTLHRLLVSGGLLRYKTDHHEYFASVLPNFTTSRWRITRETRDLINSQYIGSNIPTEFEQLFRSQALALCMVEVKKEAGPLSDTL